MLRSSCFLSFFSFLFFCVALVWFFTFFSLILVLFRFCSCRCG
jgi:hypothetical protein